MPINPTDLSKALAAAHEAGLSAADLEAADAKLAEARAAEKARAIKALQGAMKPGLFGGLDVPALSKALKEAIRVGVGRELLLEAVAKLPEASRPDLGLV